MNGFRKTYETSQKAWEGINEALFIEEEALTKIGQGRNGNCTLAYDVNIFIRKAWVDPDIDFANLFGYRIQKWSSLVRNYVDRNYLDIIAQDIKTREAKKQRNYNATIHFKNHHDSGKECLISLTFSRRLDWDIPILTFHARASEVTKRLLLDFLLVQRMAEYVYGPDQAVSIVFTTPMAYINAESFIMYHTHRNLKKLARKKIEGPLQKMQAKVLECLDKFSKVDIESITYKVHRRSARQLQRTPDGQPVSGVKSLKAKDLYLDTRKIEYPEDILTNKQRKAYKKKLKAKG